MVTKSLVEVPFSVHGLIFIESVRGPLGNRFRPPPCFKRVYVDTPMVTRPFSSVIGMSPIGGFKNRFFFFFFFFFLKPTLAHKFWLPLIHNDFGAKI